MPEDGKYRQQILASENGLLRKEIHNYLMKGGLFIPDSLGRIADIANAELVSWNKLERSKLDSTNTPTVYVLTSILNLICSRGYEDKFPLILNSEESFLNDLSEASLYVAHNTQDKIAFQTFTEAYTNMLNKIHN